MIIHYINLDTANTRRESICHNFAAVSNSDGAWTLSRFAAFGPEHEQVKKLTGSRSDTEKACFLSHYSAVMQSFQDDDYHWIVEDDICFYEQSFNVVSTFINEHQNDDWDILFTDLTIRSYPMMVDLFRMRKNVPAGKFTYINIGTCPFCSAVSYIINPKQKDKIASVLAFPEAINTTWDIFLADSIQAGKLTAYFTLPYATSFSPIALASQIRSSENDMPGVLGRAYRCLMRASPDIAMINQLLNQMDNDFVDERAATFGKIVSAFVADKFSKEPSKE